MRCAASSVGCTSAFTATCWEGHGIGGRGQKYSEGNAFGGGLRKGLKGKGRREERRHKFRGSEAGVQAVHMHRCRLGGARFQKKGSCVKEGRGRHMGGAAAAPVRNGAAATYHHTPACVSAMCWEMSSSKSSSVAHTPLWRATWNWPRLSAAPAAATEGAVMPGRYARRTRCASSRSLSSSGAGAWATADERWAGQGRSQAAAAAAVAVAGVAALPHIQTPSPSAPTTARPPAAAPDSAPSAPVPSALPASQPAAATRTAHEDGVCGRGAPACHQVSRHIGFAALFWVHVGIAQIEGGGQVRR